MAGMPAAEMAYPYQGTPATAFAVSSQQVDAAEAAAAQEELERQNEIAKTLAGRPAVKPPGISEQLTRLVDRALLPARINPLLQEMKTIMLTRTTEGIIGASVSGLKNLATIFGLGSEAAGKTEAKDVAQLIKAHIAASGMFGDSASKQEIKQFLNKMVDNPDWFTSEAQVTKQFERLQASLSRLGNDARAMIMAQPGGEEYFNKIVSTTDASQGKFSFTREAVK